MTNKMTQEDRSAPNDFGEWHLTETFKGLITLSTEVVKMLALANGGAAVALLAFLGNLEHDPGVHSGVFIGPLLQFSAGIFATLLAVIFAYLTQLKLYDEERKKRRQMSIPEHQRKPVKEYHAWILAISILMAILAAFYFLGGCVGAVPAILVGRPF
jgi:uncharacterized membrane protein YidH (DUF202 family)